MHYLALLERKTGALEQAALLEGWQLPEEFAHLRRLLQTRIGKAGSRKYIQVLRLLEDFRLEEVRATVGDAMRLGTICFDAVKHLLLCRIEQRPRTLGNISRGDPPMASLAHLHCSKTTLGAAVEAFFADRDLPPSTRRAYRATYGSLFDAGSAVAGERRQRRPGTQELTASRVPIGYCQRQGWLERDPATWLERRRTPRDETRAVPFEALDALWSRADIGLREKALWRRLYATAARASEVLALDVEDLGLGRKRAAIRGKGGHREIIVWDAATVRLLPRYLAGRRRSPIFVTAGLPNVVPAELDRSPDGQGRLSYQRAWSLFREALGGQWTLHQLRNNSLTHLGEDGVSAPLLMAKSSHQDLRTLSRYVRPGTEAVARFTAEHDHARRGKHPRR